MVKTCRSLREDDSDLSDASNQAELLVWALRSASSLAERNAVWRVPGPYPSTAADELHGLQLHIPPTPRQLQPPVRVPAPAVQGVRACLPALHADTAPKHVRSPAEGWAAAGGVPPAPWGGVPGGTGGSAALRPPGKWEAGDPARETGDHATERSPQGPPEDPEPKDFGTHRPRRLQ